MWQRDYAADAVPGEARSTAGAKPERGTFKCRPTITSRSTEPLPALVQITVFVVYVGDEVKRGAALTFAASLTLFGRPTEVQNVPVQILDLEAE